MNITRVDVTYDKIPATAPAEAPVHMPGTVTYNLNLTLSNATTLLPKIKATMNITVSNRVKIAKPGFHPIAMITAETNVNAINNNITTGGNGIKLVFTVHTAWINSISGKNSGRILNFHADINEVDLRQISGNNIVQNGNFYEITVYGNSFSSHGIVGQEAYAPGPGPQQGSYSSGYDNMETHSVCSSRPGRQATSNPQLASHTVTRLPQRLTQSQTVTPSEAVQHSRPLHRYRRSRRSVSPTHTQAPA